MTIANPTTATSRLHRCERWPDKIQHRSLEHAFAEVDRVKETKQQQLHVYACSHCGYFHLSKSSGKPGPGSDDVNIGRKVARADIPLWIASTDGGKPTLVERDERFTGPRTQRGQAIEACEAALRAHGNPIEVKAVQLGGWAGITRDRASKALAEMGWVPTGATKSRTWHRTGGAPHTRPVQPEPPRAKVEAEKAKAEAAAPPPPPQQPEWQVVDLHAVKDITVAQLLTTFKIAGKYLEVRIRDR